MTELTSKAAEKSLVVLLFITALISINLGILNLLPIPMLDGGHILFNLYEMIFRRKVPPRAFEYLSYGGMALLLSLMVFATFNDIMRVMQWIYLNFLYLILMTNPKVLFFGVICDFILENFYTILKLNFLKNAQYERKWTPKNFFQIDPMLATTSQEDFAIKALALMSVLKLWFMM